MPNYDENYNDRNMRQKDLVLAVNEFCHLLNKLYLIQYSLQKILQRIMYLHLTCTSIPTDIELLIL